MGQWWKRADLSLEDIRVSDHQEPTLDASQVLGGLLGAGQGLDEVVDDNLPHVGEGVGECGPD